MVEMTFALYSENLRLVHETINQFKTKSTVRLLVISKQQSIEKIQFIYSLGEKCFGENYVQELLRKAPQLPSDIQWTFVGSLQKNKCKALLKLKNLQRISTLDSIELVCRIQNICEKTNRTVEIMIQVKVFDEMSKRGIMVDDVKHLTEYVIYSCKNLIFKGFFVIAPTNGTEKTISECFQKVLDLRQTALLHWDSFKNAACFEISMGKFSAHDNFFLFYIQIGKTYHNAKIFDLPAK
ncbi:uncharacterized protein LOC128884146 [Hylaeus volcanicus]|uniref:uncharacterized protein LOC128884146 n=1 Tax=Hylaeus volcanicus TaxID=313075 RepID=UPI0023B7E771|nr:uncharacterized protein LOC128884146 [Hylaeus volcanicus]